MTHETRKIERKLTLKAPQSKVWDALTDPENLGQWFGQNAHFELTPKSMGWFEWQEHGKFFMRIEAFDPKNYFAWRWMSEKDVVFDKSKTTLVEWNLTPLASGGTTLIMTESGFLTPKSRNDNVEGWQEELDHLQTFLIIN